MCNSKIGIFTLYLTQKTLTNCIYGLYLCVVVYVSMFRNIFISFLFTVLTLTDCFAFSNDCHNELFRKNHPKICQQTKSITTSDTSITTIIGGAILAGAAGIALTNKLSHNSDSTNNYDNATILRSANIVSSYALNDIIKNKKIYNSYIESETNGYDIAPTTIESIRNSSNYIQNQKHFDTIKMAWAHARGFSGKNISVNILDDFAHYHGDAVHEIIGYIAPNATIYDNYLTTAANTFKSFDDIANIMKDSAPANIYNGSWQIKSTPYQNAATVAYNRFDFKTYNSAQEYMYTQTSHNFITEMINLAADNDSIFVWAAGNNYQNESGILSALPLAFPELQGHFVNVVAINPETRTLAWYSNQCGVTQNYCISAPGSNIHTNVSETSVSGTSFATPIVTGAIAVIKEAFPYMNAQQITALLFTTATDLGKPGVDEVYGWGLLNMEAATKPVGTPKIVLSNDNIIPLTETTVVGIAGSAIKNSNIQLAFVDDFGRAFKTNLSDNINVIPYGRAFAKLKKNENNSVKIFNNLELSFEQNDILQANGFLSANSANLNSVIGYGNEFNVGNTVIYQHTQFGISAPKSDNNSVISGFSDIYTASIKTGIKYKDFGFEFAIPDTIIRGNAYMNLPIERANDGTIIYNKFAIDLTTNPSFEYSVKYKNIYAGYTNNRDYQDEFYIIAKTKMIF